MARARNIKPGFFTNDELAECEPLARLLFAGLWTIADREGRLEDRPKKIKAELLPYDDCDVDKLLSQLAHKGFIVRYTVNGNAFIQIEKFSKHQNPHVKEAESLIPAPDKSDANPVQDTTQTGTSHADSLLLIPDSLNPIKASSGKPSVPHFRDEAKEIIDFLNAKSGRNFRHVEENIRPIAARLKGGASVQQCKSIIVKKIREWTGDPKTEVWIRPETIFRASKFEQYLGQLVEAPNEPRMPGM